MNKSGYNGEKSIGTNPIITALYRLEDGILVALLTLMMGVAVVQILLRNFSGTGIIWGDVLVRIAVLWLGLVGAMVAARQDKHISIDLVMRYLPERLRMCVNAIVRLFAAVVCAWTAYYSFIFVVAEYTEGGLAFGQVPVWVCEAVIPLAFTVMALRYLAMSVPQFRAVFAAKRIAK
jgi:TRAP-type C4-dicarboxylate transport system permease small subunit